MSNAESLGQDDSDEVQDLWCDASDSTCHSATKEGETPEQRRSYGLAARVMEEIPGSFEDALKSPRAHEWKEAMQREMDSMYRHTVWELAERPKARRLVANKWVYAIKFGMDGNLKFKARLVAKGFTQQAGVDYEEIYSPVARQDSLRVLLSLAAHHGWHIRQFDVSTAFLNADIDKEIYMAQPKGFDDGSGRVCRLRRSIYGLCQSPRLWFERFASELKQLRFEQLEKDQCIFVRKAGPQQTILILYVDDGLVLGTSEEETSQVLTALSKRFQMTKADGNVLHYVGMTIEIGDKGIHVHQRSHIERIVNTFHLQDAKAVKTPFPSSGMTDEHATDADEAIRSPFKSLIGSLLYISNGTRPDIAFAVNRLSQFCSRVQKSHFQLAKRVVCYLKGTTELKIFYPRGQRELVVKCYCDSDFAMDLIDRRSTSGAILLVNMSPVSWFSRKQKCLSQSTLESEFVAANEATKEAIWLRHFLEELGEGYVSPMALYCDNTGTVDKIKNNNYHNRTKHFDYRMKLTREAVKEGWLSISHVGTKNQLADVLTKPLSLQDHNNCVFTMNIVA